MNNNLLALISLGANKPQFKLNSEGKIPEEYLPSYVDDVIELIAVSDTVPASCSKGDKYFNTSSKKIFTATSNNAWGSTGKTPEKDKIYINTADDPATSWRWSGTDLVLIGGGASSVTRTEYLLPEDIYGSNFPVFLYRYSMILNIGNAWDISSVDQLDSNDNSPLDILPKMVMHCLNDLLSSINRESYSFIGFNIDLFNYNYDQFLTLELRTSDFKNTGTPANVYGFSIKKQDKKESVYTAYSLNLTYSNDGVITRVVFKNKSMKEPTLIPTDNIIAYTPTQDYHPATKKYVDEKAGSNKAFHVIPQQGTWKLGANSKAEIIAVLNEYLQTGGIPKASVALSSSYGVPILYGINNSASGNDAVQVTLLFHGLYIWHSAQTDWGVQSKDLRSGGSFTVYVSKAEWDAKNITAVYYGSYQGSSATIDFNSNYVGARVMIGNPIAANHTIQKISNGSVPKPGSSQVSNIYWWGSPRVYDSNRNMWFEPNHFYHCEQENVSSGNYRMYDFLYRQAIEAVYTELGLEEYDIYGIYAVDDYVYFKGKIYKCLTAKPDQTASQFVPLNWSEVTLINYLKIVLAA